MQGIVTVSVLIIFSILIVALFAVVKITRNSGDALMSPDWQRRRNAYRWERRAAR